MHSQRPQSKKKPSKSEQQQVARLYKQIHQTKSNYQRWLAAPETVIACNGSGVVALATLANAATIQSSCPDFASLATLYTAYRCRAIRVRLLPLYLTPVWDGTVLRTAPCAIAVYPWMTNNVPTTFQQALDVTGVKVVSAYKADTVLTSYRGDPDAHLWTGTGSAIGSNEQFGVSCIGTALASTASLSVMKVLVDYLVEFRMVG